MTTMTNSVTKGLPFRAEMQRSLDALDATLKDLGPFFFARYSEARRTGEAACTIFRILDQLSKIRCALDEGEAGLLRVFEAAENEAASDDRRALEAVERARDKAAVQRAKDEEAAEADRLFGP